MQVIHFNPAPALAPYIAFYGSIAVDENFHEPYCSPPLGLCGFHFNFEGENNASLKGEVFLKDRFCAGGQITMPINHQAASDGFRNTKPGLEMLFPPKEKTK